MTDENRRLLVDIMLLDSELNNAPSLEDMARRAKAELARAALAPESGGREAGERWWTLQRTEVGGPWNPDPGTTIGRLWAKQQDAEYYRTEKCTPELWRTVEAVVVVQTAPSSPSSAQGARCRCKPDGAGGCDSSECRVNHPAPSSAQGEEAREPTACAECGHAVTKHAGCYGHCSGRDGMGCDCPAWTPKRFGPSRAGGGA